MSKSWIINRFTNPANDSITAKYIQIKKFSQDDSITILNALKDKDSSVYFQDTTGNIKVNSIQFINPLLSKPWDNTVSLSSYKVSLNPESNYIFSKPHGAWALYYKTNGSLYMLYNPIPRPEWSEKYMNFNYTGDIYKSTVDVCTDTKSEDPVCACINLVSKGDTEFCMDQLVAGGDSEVRRNIKYSTINGGIKTKDPVESGPGSGTWNSISNVCHCSNQKCSKSHPFEKAHLINNKCPENLQVAICSVGFNAGGNITQTSPTSFQQSCINRSGESDPTKPTPQSTTGPSDNSDPSSPSGYSGPTGPSGATGASGPSGATGGSGQYTNSELSPVSTIKKIIYIGGGIVIIALIAYGLYSFLFSSEKATKSIVNTPIIETVKPPIIETVKPPIIETVKPPIIETVKPPIIETVKPPIIETVKPPIIEPLKAPVIESVKPPITPVNAPIIEPVKAAFKASFRFKRR